MKRLFSATAAVVAVASAVVLGLSTAGGATSASANLAPDPDFESNPGAAYYTAGTATFSWATDAAHSATHSLKIVSTQPPGTLTRWMSNTSAIAATPGTTYTASAYLRTGTGGTAANLSVDFWDGNRTYLGETDDSARVGTAGSWTYVSVTAKAPPRSAYIRVEFRLFGAGTLWADDVAVTTDTGAGGPPVNVALPAISGPTPPDNTMTASTGTWTGSPTSFSYQWQDCVRDVDYCTPIAGESGPTLHLPWDSSTKSLKVTVVATNAAGSTSVTSDRGGFTANFVVYTPPRIVGARGTAPVFTVGSELAASHPAWTGEATVWDATADPVTWLRCDASGQNCFKAATGDYYGTYTVSAADEGHRLRVVFEEIYLRTDRGQTVGAASEPSPVITR